ncbi:serine/threonine/tyrosine-protein kinase HT1-like [Homarus americanus]|uniref:serine/threonine/tyrosine-protein kinase HT1-like n=1 Tax=Homarus americanus TaxID=6706 RepID=UPI001C47D4DD|nr:serine/threonine/tyrosine-protein kinase HT1-like [Homarus americanus]
MDCVYVLDWEEVQYLVDYSYTCLGSGSHGAAYLVDWYGEENVLKVAHKTLSLKSFWKEAEKLVHLNGAGGAPRVTGFCQDPPAILQEFKGRYTLKDIIEEFVEEKFTQYDILDLALRIGEQLYEFHQTGLIHNDLKFDNILINGPPTNPQVSIIDVGLACYCHENIKFVGGTGKYPWMAPEVREGYSSTKASDTYSFGVLLSNLANMVLGVHPEVCHLASQAMKPHPRQRIHLRSLLHRLRRILFQKNMDSE